MGILTDISSEKAQHLYLVDYPVAKNASISVAIALYGPCRNNFLYSVEW